MMKCSTGYDKVKYGVHLSIVSLVGNSTLVRQEDGKYIIEKYGGGYYTSPPG